jgi:hypothetical protein
MLVSSFQEDISNKTTLYRRNQSSFQRLQRPMPGQEAWGLTFLEVEKIERHP